MVRLTFAIVKRCIHLRSPRNGARGRISCRCVLEGNFLRNNLKQHLFLSLLPPLRNRRQSWCSSPWSYLSQRSLRLTKDKSTFAYVCYNCGYGSHAETDCVVCGTYMRSNKQDARLCMDCGWTTFPENCAHCNQPLGSTKIRGYACSDCTTGALRNSYSTVNPLHFSLYTKDPTCISAASCARECNVALS